MTDSTDLDPRQVVAPGVLELDLDGIDPIAGVLCGARVWALHEGDARAIGLPPECVDAVIMDPPAGIAFMGKDWDKDKGGEGPWVDWLASILKVAFDALKPGGHALVWSLPRTSYLTALALRKAGFAIRDTIDHVNGSGFPKSLDLSKAIDAAVGAKRCRVGGSKRDGAVVDYASALRCDGCGKTRNGTSCNCAVDDGPATAKAARWAGWGTALRPNKEVWWLALRPRARDTTIAANVLRHGVGGLNIDAARVTGGGPSSGGESGGQALGVMNDDGWISKPRAIDRSMPDGRWPSNITFQHASWDESECRACGVTAPFAVRFCPACGSGDIEHRRGGCRCVGERRVRVANWTEDDRSRPTGEFGNGANTRGSAPMSYGADGLETVDAWECLATCDRCGASALLAIGGDAGWCACGAARRWACAVALLDEQSGERVSGSRAAGVRKGAGYSGGAKGDGGPAIEASAGGASRFFHCFPPEPFEPPPFVYSAKPSTAEKEIGLSGEAGHASLPRRSAGELVGREDGSAGTQSPRGGAGRASAGRANHHPTIKGFHLLGHLCDLVLPPGGIVLDLTAGSGTLGAVVAHRHAATGWRCIMAELDPEHCRIIRERCRYWGARPWRPRAKGGSSAKASKPAVVAAQPSLFDEASR